MSRTPLDIEYSETVSDIVTTEDFEWDDERVCHEVVVHSRVEELNCAVVGR